MFFTLGLKELPFEQDTRQIIYVEGAYDEEVNRLIQENYLDIREYFYSCGYEFCYIPLMKQDLCKNGSLQYAAPYAKEGNLGALDDNFLLQYMVHPENREKIPPSLLYYDSNCRNEQYSEAICQYRGISISASSFDEDVRLKGVLLDILNEIEKNSHNIMFCERDDDTIRFSIAKEDAPLSADETFDRESTQLLEEIKERIEKLKQKGIGAYVLKTLIMDEKVELSRLHITSDYRIFLPDFNNIEITMTPLPKAVFLLFLKHPEGIMFSYLPDYREELMDIYRKVKGPFFNRFAAKRSIEDVTDPLSNSINEKCSRIREAFISQFDERLARYYFVRGARGEAKKIALPRELVVFT